MGVVCSGLWAPLMNYQLFLKKKNPSAKAKLKQNHFFFLEEVNWDLASLSGKRIQYDYDL